jgi:hypothetical protein
MVQGVRGVAVHVQEVRNVINTHIPVLYIYSPHRQPHPQATESLNISLFPRGVD